VNSRALSFIIVFIVSFLFLRLLVIEFAGNALLGDSLDVYTLIKKDELSYSCEDPAVRTSDATALEELNTFMISVRFYCSDKTVEVIDKFFDATKTSLYVICDDEIDVSEITAKQTEGGDFLVRVMLYCTE